MHRETECCRIWRISSRCHLWAKLNISVQRRNSTIRSRKDTTMLHLLLILTDGKAHFDLQRIYSAQKSRGFKAIRFNWWRKRNWSSRKCWDCYNYWCSWYWCASTFAEFTRILRMDFDKSWSRKTRKRNSSWQLWHRELQFLVARRKTTSMMCVSNLHNLPW